MGAEGIDGRTDVFAFGAILFEALSGQRAFDGPNFNALIVKIATTQPKRIDDVAADVPESLRAIIRECMVTDKTKRLESFDRVVDAARRDHARTSRKLDLRLKQPPRLESGSEPTCSRRPSTGAAIIRPPVLAAPAIPPSGVAPAPPSVPTSSSGTAAPNFGPAARRGARSPSRRDARRGARGLRDRRRVRCAATRTRAPRRAPPTRAPSSAPSGSNEAPRAPPPAATSRRVERRAGHLGRFAARGDAQRAAADGHGDGTAHDRLEPRVVLGVDRRRGSRDHARSRASSSRGRAPDRLRATERQGEDGERHDHRGRVGAKYKFSFDE